MKVTFQNPTVTGCIGRTPEMCRPAPKKMKTASRMTNAEIDAASVKTDAVPVGTGEMVGRLLRFAQDCNGGLMKHEKGAYMLVSDHETLMDHHARMAAEARAIIWEELRPSWSGPNIRRLKEADALLRELAGIPHSPNAEVSGRGEKENKT